MAIHIGSVRAVRCEAGISLPAEQSRLNMRVDNIVALDTKSAVMVRNDWILREIRDAIAVPSGIDDSALLLVVEAAKSTTTKEVVEIVAKAAPFVALGADAAELIEKISDFVKLLLNII